MRHTTRIALTTLLLTAAVACGGKQPEMPAPMSQNELDDSERARREAEERARREAEERARREAEEARLRAEEAARLRATLEEMVFFDFDRFDIRPDAAQLLQAKVPHLRGDGSIRLRIEGHADERGSIEYNLALGMRRATAARDYLAGHGLEPGRFTVDSFGESRPLAQGASESAWARNRRAEFRVDGETVAARP